MRDLTQIDADQLESILDRTQLVIVVEAIAQICRLKALHIREAWQDDELARRWIRGAMTLEKVAESKAVKAVP